MKRASIPPRTRVLHVTTVPMSLTFLRGQVAYMRERGLEVAALSSPGPDLEAFARSEEMRVHAVEMPRQITPLRDAVAIVEICRVIARDRPQIVHAHTPKGGLLGMIAAALMRVPVRIYHMRGLPLETATGLTRLLLRWSERLSCTLAHLVLCNSQSMRETALGERLSRPERMKVLAKGSGNGVDAAGRFDPTRLEAGVGARVREQLGISPDALVVGFVGRLVGDKGVMELTAAWQRLRERYASAHLLLVGPFEERDPIPATVRQALENDPRVHLTGMDWNTPPLYAAMDLVVLPSYREGFPNVPLEAAAMGLPVVTTRVSGCVDAVVDGTTGLLVPARNADALEEAIARYLADPDLRRRHGEAGRARVVADFTPERIWAALFDEYRSLLDRSGQPLPSPASAAIA